MAEDIFYSAKHWAKKAEKSAIMSEKHSQASGRIIQVGFDGTLEGDTITFKHAPGGREVPYDLFDDYEYELDLSFQAVGELPVDTKMVVKNGNDMITFVSAVHRDSTVPATVSDMAAVMRYNEVTGFRWLFKAAYKITPAGTKVFLLYPVVSTTITYWG